MSAALRAGIVFFLLVFGAGFLFGSLREGLMGLGLSRNALVLLELPLMLAIAWFAAGWSASRFGVPTATAVRLTMGATMLILLRFAEWAVGAWLMGLPLAQQLAAAATPMGAVETGTQVLAALFPALRARLLE